MVQDDLGPSWYENLCAKLLQVGPMPRHIALILDGNRRYARMKGMANVTEGHRLGFRNLVKVVELFIAFGIPELTAFMFSIDNFKRSKEEVDGIMVEMERTILKLREIEGLRLEIVGNVDRTPVPTLRDLMERSMLETRGNRRLKVNIAFIYTGRDEITRGAQKVVRGLENEKGKVTLTPDLFFETFTLTESYPIDIMIRTSGESRLSDFVTWGCSEALLEFVPETWPEFDYWSLWRAVFRYQRQVLYEGLKEIETANKENGGKEGNCHQNWKFLRAWRESEFDKLKSKHCPTKTKSSHKLKLKL